MPRNVHWQALVLLYMVITRFYLRITQILTIFRQDQVSDTYLVVITLSKLPYSSFPLIGPSWALSTLICVLKYQLLQLLFLNA